RSRSISSSVVTPDEMPRSSAVPIRLPSAASVATSAASTCARREGWVVLKGLFAALRRPKKRASSRPLIPSRAAEKNALALCTVGCLTRVPAGSAGLARGLASRAATVGGTLGLPLLPNRIPGSIALFTTGRGQDDHDAESGFCRSLEHSRRGPT